MPAVQNPDPTMVKAGLESWKLKSLSQERDWKPSVRPRRGFWLGMGTANGKSFRLRSMPAERGKKKDGFSQKFPKKGEGIFFPAKPDQRI